MESKPLLAAGYSDPGSSCIRTAYNPGIRTNRQARKPAKVGGHPLIPANCVGDPAPKAEILMAEVGPQPKNHGKSLISATVKAV